MINHRISFLFLFLSAMIYLVDEHLVESNLKFLLLNGLLLLYSICIIGKAYANNQNVLEPLIISLIANQVIFLGGGTSFLIMKDGEFVPGNSASLIPWDPIFLVKFGFLLNLGTVCMIHGYYSNFGIRASYFNYKHLLKSHVTNLWMSKNTLIILAIVGVAAKLYLMQNGLFGRLLSEEHTVFGDSKDFLASQLAPLNRLSLIPFSFVAYRYYKRVNGYTFLFFTLAGIEIFFAFIEGSRKPILELYVLIFLIYYYAQRKVRLSFFIGGFLVLYIAFTLVLEFKSYVINNKVSATDPVTLVRNFFEYRDEYQSEIQEHVYSKVEENILYRINFVTQATSAIRHADLFGVGSNDPDFLIALLLVPIDVVVPKSIQGEPAINWGDWFRFSVLKRGFYDTTYSIPFSPIGYLYFLGGYVAIAIGFFIYGILLRSIALLPKAGFIGFLFFLLLLTCLGMFESAIPQSLVRYSRYMLLLPLVYKFGRRLFIYAN